MRADTAFGNTALRPFPAARAHWSICGGATASSSDPGTASDETGKAPGTEGSLQTPIAGGYGGGAPSHEHHDHHRHQTYHGFNGYSAMEYAPSNTVLRT